MRTSIISGEFAKLQKFISAFPTQQLPGRIALREYLESEVPEQVCERFFQKGVAYEQQIAHFVKCAGQNGPELTLQGKRVLRFSEYDPDSQIEDVLVEHDN